MTWYLVQFHSDGKRFRLIDRAYEDGYSHGDRFLEGADFEVVLTSDRSDFNVKATPNTEGYLLGVYSSPEAWSKQIKESLVKHGGDNLTADDRYCTNGWDRNEVHLVDDYSYYITDGFTLEE